MTETKKGRSSFGKAVFFCARAYLAVPPAALSASRRYEKPARTGG
ncbi:hypothetical protein HDC29_001682 [Sphingopyxis sp. JAI108]|nr:hypothetical protein [Sphingopyxis sp. JAI108]